MRSFLKISPCCLVLVFTGTLLAQQHQNLFFEQDIRPIFREFCFDCHGATNELEGKLDLRLVRFLKQGGDSGPSISSEDPASSYLLERIQSGEMPPGEAHVPPEKIALIEQWISQGAKTKNPEPETLAPGVRITEEDRKFWSFQPITDPPVPTNNDPRIRTSVDAFIRDAMPDGLTFSMDAERNTLIRRVYFDLIGLPPTLEQIQHWQDLNADDWYEQMVDQVLQSPHYGERWARHWLDVAGYADSEGSTVRDDERPWAWKYRDYVIRSLNDDKPFNQFIVEQLAGDELAGPIQGDLSDKQIELLTATGFLRMSADGTGSGDNSPEARNKVIADTIQIVSSSLLGLSVACAQCHDHRYDPISQVDYYGMRAVFAPAYDWQNWKVPSQRRVSLYTENDRLLAAQIEEQVKSIVAERTRKQNEYMAQALAEELEKYEDPLKAQLSEAYKTPANERTEEQKSLLKKYPSVNITPGVLYQYIPESREELAKYDQQIADARAKKTPEEFLRVLTEPSGHVPITRLFHRGDHQQPKQDVAPSALTITLPTGEIPVIQENDQSLPTTGRRLAYARWITSDRHPLLARVIVNRVWLHHFGRGLVSTPADFGRLGDTPSHPELLDWLATNFMQNGWSLKKLHRLILTSTAWRQSSVPHRDMHAIDPENRFYWRKSIQRLEAEVIRDRMLASSGSLDTQLYGAPVNVKADETGQVMVDGEQTRRSLYIKMRRSTPVAMLETFDAPVMKINCERRPVSTVATQSLMLMNGSFTLRQAQKLSDRARENAPKLDQNILNSLPVLPEPPEPIWRYGYGTLNENSGQTNYVSDLPHWTGAEWQGGEQRPDPTIGWVILNASGGHPGNAQHCAIRRWTAPVHGKVNIEGRLRHSSENGDGVRGRIITREGVIGEWQVQHGDVITNVDDINVKHGETIDFMTDCLTNENSDSFQWTVTMVLSSDDAERRFDSVQDYHGPVVIDETHTLPRIMRQAWLLCYQQDPTDEQLQLAVNFARQQLIEMYETGRGVPAGRSPSQQVLINFCQILLTSNQFLYID